MKFLLVAAFAAVFLVSVPALAQPGHGNHDRGGRGEAADRKNHKAEGHNSGRAIAREPASGAPQAPRTGQSDAPGRAAATRMRDRHDSSPPSARVNQTSQPMRDRSPDWRGRDGSRTGQRSAPSPQSRDRSRTTNNSARPNRDSRWSRGDRLPDQYRNDQHYVNDWRQYGLRRPSRGYRWVRNDNNDFYLTLIATGVILDTVYRSDRDERWRDRYSRNYSYDDDIYYQQCRRSADPAGILAGGLIGGLLGNAAGGRHRTGSTIAGVIFGGAVGAALTSNMDCDDRSYAYRSYYDGFNSGRVGRHQWRNPHSGHRGVFRIGSYYNDPYGFRCARFSQVTYIRGRAYRDNGVACRQPDGVWAAVR